MAGRLSTHLVCVFLFLTPLLALAPISSAETAGSIAFSSEGIAMNPASPVEGGAVTFTLSLQNIDNVIAEDVQVEFHKSNYVQGSPSAAHSLDIAADAFEQIEFSWSNLGFGSQDVFVRVSHAGESGLISHSFDVGGLANLRFGSLGLSPTTGVYQNDLITIQIQVENAGHADAGASHLELTFAGAANLLSVPPLQVGDSVWLNQTANAPAAGSYSVIGVVNADSGDGVVESTTADNQNTATLVVEVQPDYRHADGPNVVAEAGSLDGPWTVSGTIARDGGSGDSTVPLEVRIKDGHTLKLIYLTFSDVDVFAAYSLMIEADNLTSSEPGDSLLELAIDPSGDVEQSNTFNDISEALLTIHQEPNVVVAETAVASPPSVTPGLSLTFEVSLQNVGMVMVFGTLSATFDGEILGSETVSIPASNTAGEGQRTVTFTTPPVSGETRNIPFTATWAKSTDSHDRLATDNQALGLVHLISDMQLSILKTTEFWSPGLPLHSGYDYVYSVEIRANQGSGSETFECVDRISGHVFDRVTLDFAEGATKELRCVVHPDSPGDIEFTIIPDGASVSPYGKIWLVKSEDGSGGDADNGWGDDPFAAILLISLVAALCIATLVAAIILTRRGLADANRETYDLCPACEGELEDEEQTCPHCDFDLRGAQAKFHDCESCHATIPSMMEHCPFCGEEQDLRDHYKKRERKTKPLPDPEATEALPEEDEFDEDEVVRGSDTFETHAGEMGFDEDQWEGEWEDNISEAEAYFDGKEEQAQLVAETEVDAEDETGDIVESTRLRKAMDELPDHDLDAFLGEIGERRHLTDEQVELSASDAHYRGHLYDLIGERGVMPGEEVTVGTMVDTSIVGNEVRTASSDFTVKDEALPEPEPEPAPEPEPEPESDAGEDEAKEAPRRRGVRRRKKED